MIYDPLKSHNLADEQLDEAYSDGDRGHDDARSEVDLMLSNARLQPLTDLSELRASAQAHVRRSKPRCSDHGREPEGARADNKRRDLVFPTDGAALLFSLLIFGVAIFELNQAFLAEPEQLAAAR